MQHRLSSEAAWRDCPHPLLDGCACGDSCRLDGPSSRLRSVYCSGAQSPNLGIGYGCGAALYCPRAMEVGRIMNSASRSLMNVSNGGFMRHCRLCHSTENSAQASDAASDVVPTP